MEEIRECVVEFAKSREWYRKLMYSGSPFVIFPMKGRQPKNPLDVPPVIDKITWWIYEMEFVGELGFNKNITRVLKQHKFYFNCFLGGIHGRKDDIIGWETIQKRDPHIVDKLRAAHPESGSIEAMVGMEAVQQVERAIAAAEAVTLLVGPQLGITIPPYDSSDEDVKKNTHSASTDGLTESFYDRQIDNTLEELARIPTRKPQIHETAEKRVEEPEKRQPVRRALTSGDLRILTTALEDSESDDHSTLRRAIERISPKVGRKRSKK
jgi:hypothetical protein